MLLSWLVLWLLVLLSTDLVSAEDEEDHRADEDEDDEGEEDDVALGKGVHHRPVVHRPRTVPYHRVQSPVIVPRACGL